MNRKLRAVLHFLLEGRVAPNRTEEMIRIGRVWRWDRVSGWLAVCPACQSTSCQCSHLSSALRPAYAADPPPMFKRGDRVRVTHRSGFSRGAEGTVEFQEPGGFRPKCWVIRDGAVTPCCFYNDELEKLPPKRKPRKKVTKK